jgi:FixJ family two-component response regulator
MADDSTPTVYVVDDDAAIREAMMFLVDSVGARAMPFANGPEFLEAFVPGQPGCIVLDMFLPGMSGIEVMTRLGRVDDRIPIVFTSAFSDVPMAVDAMKRGALDFLQKPFENAAFVGAVRSALRRDAEQRDTRRLKEDGPSRLAMLTPRERDILELVVSGKTNKVIGRALDISYKTVEAHRSRLMKKMRVSCLAELVQLFLLHRDQIGMDPLPASRRVEAAPMSNEGRVA